MGRRSPVERVEASERVGSVARVPDSGGWRARVGELRHPNSVAGVTCLDVAVGDCNRVAYAGPLPDGRVMADDGPGHRSRAFDGWLEVADVKHERTRPHSPSGMARRNG